MREIACEQCGRRVTVGGDAVMCPSCGFTVRPEAQSPAAAPLGMDMSGMETRVAAAPAALAATAATTAGGQAVCPQCGRGVMTNAGAAAVCPSCGFALSAPAAAVDVSAMETRVAPMPAAVAVAVEAPAVAAMESASGVDAAATRVADAAPPATATQADTAATQVAAIQPAAPTRSPEQPAFGQAPFGQQPPGMPPTATYPYPGIPGGPMMSPAPPPPPSKKTPAALIAVLVALAVIVVAGVLFAALALARAGGLGSASATAVPTATATATAIPTATPSPTPSSANVPAGFTAYQDPSGLYQMVYPTGWTKTSTSGDLGLAVFGGTDASGANVFEVEYIKSSSPGSATAIADAFFSTLSNTAHGQVSNKQGPTPVSLAGESWTQESADVTGATGSAAAQHVVVQVTAHGGNTFVIAYLAPAASFDAANASTFKPMLDSFAFLK